MFFLLNILCGIGAFRRAIFTILKQTKISIYIDRLKPRSRLLLKPVLFSIQVMSVFRFVSFGIGNSTISSISRLSVRISVSVSYLKKWYG